MFHPDPIAINILKIVDAPALHSIIVHDPSSGCSYRKWMKPWSIYEQPQHFRWHLRIGSYLLDLARSGVVKVDIGASRID